MTTTTPPPAGPTRTDLPQTGEGNVDPLSGEPVETAPDINPADGPAEGTPGDEPYPPEDRGQPATIDRATGAVHGSGAGAGGGNAGEDYDSGSEAGSGDEPEGAARRIEDAVRGREDQQQGTSA